jgi:hypothetical protein
VERLVLPPALSCAVLILGGLGMYASGVLLTRISWTALTAGVTVLAGLVAVLRRRAPVAATPAVTETAMLGRVLVSEQERLSPRTAAWRLAPLVIAVLLAVGAGLLAFGGANHDHRTFTALALVPAPAPDDRSGLRSVQLSVRCQEEHPTDYSLRVVVDQGVIQTFAVSLRPGGAWAQTLQVPSAGTVTAELFRGNDTAPYRSVHLAGTG